MKICLALAGTAFVAASPALDVTLEHGVAEGATVDKSLAHECSLELVSAVMSMDDMEEPMPDGFAMSLEFSRNVEVVDVYGPTEDGVLQSLTRTIDTIDDEFTAVIDEAFGNGEEETEIVLDSELEGEAVRWTRGDDGYEAAFADEESELEAEALAGLTFDLDGIGLLPPADADLAAGWDVPAAALGELLAQGGAFGGVPADEPDDLGDCLLRSVVLLPLLGELEGDVTLTLDSFDEDAGLATLSLEAEVTSEAEGLDFVTSLAEGVDIEELETIYEVLLETELTLEGTIVWNVADKHLESVDVTGEVARMIEVLGHQPMMDADMTVTLEFEGEASWKLELAGE